MEPCLHPNNVALLPSLLCNDGGLVFMHFKQKHVRMFPSEDGPDVGFTPAEVKALIECICQPKATGKQIS